MLFNSYIFIFVFFPIVLFGWFGLNHFKAYNLAKIFLCGMSLWFYAYFNSSYLVIIICSILANYLISFIVTKLSRPYQKKLALIVGILTNLGILFYFKYYDFFFENINVLFHTDFNMKHILLPLGISFFTFQQLSYIIDRCTDQAKHYSLVDYASFVTFFPQLIAGPIVLHSELVPQFNDMEKKKPNAANFQKGIFLFTIGLAKKVLLADVLALFVNYGFEQTNFLDTPSTILVVLAYTFELYFDFSGYCDMAMGIGSMFNITLPINFNSPYKACSVKELWQRWHMTLSRFFITYVYIPLGGSKKGKARTILNTMIVFALSGLWHGANWTFITWGILQGLLVVWDNLGIVGIKKTKEKKPARFHLPRFVGWLFTFSFFNLSLYFFRSNTMTDAFQLLKNLFAFKETGYLLKLVPQLDIPEFYLIKQVINMVQPELLTSAYVLLFFLIMLISAFILTRRNSMELVDRVNYNSKLCWGLTILFVWSVISFSQVSTFIYFNF